MRSCTHVVCKTRGALCVDVEKRARGTQAEGRGPRGICLAEFARLLRRLPENARGAHPRIHTHRADGEKKLLRPRRVCVGFAGPALWCAHVGHRDVLKIPLAAHTVLYPSGPWRRIRKHRARNTLIVLPPAIVVLGAYQTLSPCPCIGQEIPRLTHAIGTGVAQRQQGVCVLAEALALYLHPQLAIHVHSTRRTRGLVDDGVLFVRTQYACTHIRCCVMWRACPGRTTSTCTRALVVLVLSSHAPCASISRHYFRGCHRRHVAVVSGDTLAHNGVWCEQGPRRIARTLQAIAQRSCRALH